jgi:hypothetical protein
MKINVLITCYNNEDHLPVLLGVLQTYKTLQPQVGIIYAGTDKNFVCNVRIAGTKPHSRELAMIVEGMKWFKSKYPETPHYIKLSAHVWPLDEEKLIKLIADFDASHRCYAGNKWHHNLEGSLSSDFFLLNTDYGNVFKDLTQVINDTEVTIYRALKEKNKYPYLIPERAPVFWNNFHQCEKLCMTLRPKLEENLEAVKRLKKEITIL